MQGRNNDRPTDNMETAAHPLKTLTAAQFAALGGNAVIFVRHIKGDDLSEMLEEPGFIDEQDYHLVMSADGTALFVADTREAVEEWLAERNFGVVQLH
jgi:hypothetical protein